MTKKSTITIIVLIIIIAILITIIAIQNFDTTDIPTPPIYNGIVSESQCGGLDTITEKDACCAELNKYTAHIECVGDWVFRHEQEDCAYVCGGRQFNPNL